MKPRCMNALLGARFRNLVSQPIDVLAFFLGAGGVALTFLVSVLMVI